MKKIILANLLALSSLFSSYANTPQTISYQAIVRNAYGEIIQSAPIGIRINLLSQSEDGPSVFTEERIENTNENGLISFAIGAGDNTQAIEQIDWSNGPYFIQCELDLNGGKQYTLSITKPITSVPYALYAERISPSALPDWITEEKPTYHYSEIAGAPQADSSFQLSPAAQITLLDIQAWNNKLTEENDPLFKQSIAAKITKEDTIHWNQKLSEENDPYFLASAASTISSEDVKAWNSKLSEESDPIFSKSVAAQITTADTAKWNRKVASESDPYFAASTAAQITQSDVQKWNNKVSTESDPIFSKSVAAQITTADTAKWNRKVASESDPYFAASTAAKITQSDVQKWNNKVSTESDPFFSISTAATITPTDITNWNNKVTTEKDPIFSKSVAAQITTNDLQNWNNKIGKESDPLFSQSLAAKITSADTAKWGKKTTIPQNVSAFQNDAQYITANDTKEMVNTLNALVKKVEAISNANNRLNHMVDSLSTITLNIQANTSTNYIKAENYTYGFSQTDWNYGPDLYKNLNSEDRIIYIVRHSERDENCSGKECDLNNNGVLLAQNVGKNYVGGIAGSNQSYYGSTEYPRCKNTSYLVAINRGDTQLSSKEEVINPIKEIDQKFIVGSESNWDNIAKWYGEHPIQTYEKATTMVNALCKLTEGKKFAWFTSHDFLTVPLCGWATSGNLNFARPNWMNFMSGIAVIVHPNGTWEVYPIRNLDQGYGTVSWYK